MGKICIERNVCAGVSVGYIVAVKARIVTIAAQFINIAMELDTMSNQLRELNF